jgi:hypothetical protein
MLSHGRIPLRQAEHEAIDRLLAKHPGTAAGLTRRDAGDSGPVLVHIGDATWVVDETGKTTKQRRAR